MDSPGSGNHSDALQTPPPSSPLQLPHTHPHAQQQQQPPHPHTVTNRRQQPETKTDTEAEQQVEFSQATSFSASSSAEAQDTSHRSDSEATANTATPSTGKSSAPTTENHPSSKSSASTVSTSLSTNTLASSSNSDAAPSQQSLSSAATGSGTGTSTGTKLRSTATPFQPQPLLPLPGLVIAPGLPDSLTTNTHHTKQFTDVRDNSSEKADTKGEQLNQETDHTDRSNILKSNSVYGGNSSSADGDGKGDGGGVTKQLDKQVKEATPAPQVSDPACHTDSSDNNLPPVTPVTSTAAATASVVTVDSTNSHGNLNKNHSHSHSHSHSEHTDHHHQQQQHGHSPGHGHHNGQGHGSHPTSTTTHGTKKRSPDRDKDKDRARGRQLVTPPPGLDIEDMDPNWSANLDREVERETEKVWAQAEAWLEAEMMAEETAWLMISSGSGSDSAETSHQYPLLSQGTPFLDLDRDQSRGSDGVDDHSSVFDLSTDDDSNHCYPENNDQKSTSHITHLALSQFSLSIDTVSANESQLSFGGQFTPTRAPPRHPLSERNGLQATFNHLSANGNGNGNGNGNSRFNEDSGNQSPSSYTSSLTNYDDNSSLDDLSLSSRGTGPRTLHEKLSSPERYKRNRWTTEEARQRNEDRQVVAEHNRDKTVEEKKLRAKVRPPSLPPPALALLCHVCLDLFRLSSHFCSLMWAIFF